MKETMFVVLLALSTAAFAKTYYVAPTGGSDIYPGSITQPWATWQKAFNTATNPGDTVYFRGGTWSPLTESYGVAVLANNIKGTHDNPICFFAYPGEKPILDLINISSSYNTAVGLNITNCNNLKFKGLTVKNRKQSASNRWIAGIATSSDDGHGNIYFENMSSYGHGGSGYFLVQWDTLYLVNCDSYNNCDSLDSGGSLGGRADGFNISSRAPDVKTKYAFVHGCRSWFNSDDAFDIGHTKQIECTNNWAWNCGRLNGDGNGFKLSYSIVNDPSKRKFYNNMAAYNTSDGFTDANLEDSINGPFGAFYNNTIYKCYRGFSSVPGEFNCRTPGDTALVIYRNNLVYNCTAAPNMEQVLLYANYYGYPNYTIQENNTFIPDPTTSPWWLYNPAITVTNDDFVSLDSTQLYRERKSDGSLPDITFMKLASGSDLIDYGVNVGLPYYGTSTDLGYSEYITGEITLPSPILISAAINNATPAILELTFNSIFANIVPAASAFSVMVNSVARTVRSIAILGTKVQLTLASPVVYGDAVTVAYTKPATNPLQTASGGQAASLTTRNVTNNVTATTANQSPIVSISSPIKSTSFIAPATITIEVVASDPDGTIVKVEFYNGSVKLGERTIAPYSYTWKEVTEGTYSIFAVAADNQNLRTVSSAVSVVVEKSATSVNQLPSVSITSPNKGKKYKKNDKIVIEAFASDPDGSVSKVEFKNGGTTLAEVTASPYIYIWEAMDIGTYMVTVIATDNSGATSTPSNLELIVDFVYDANSEIINLYPNPNDGRFLIDLFSPLPNDHNQITIVSLSGKMVFNDIITEQENSREFDLSDRSPGTYVLMITSGNTIVTSKKFIKQ